MNKLIWTRNFVSNNSKWSYLISSIDAIDEDVYGNSSTIYDISKSLIESVCKTILTDRGVEFTSTESLPKLAKKVSDQYVEDGMRVGLSKHEEKALEKITRSITTLIQELGYLRNKLGKIGHGRDIEDVGANDQYAQMIILLTDALVGFLISSHDASISPAARSRLHYEDHEDFNQFIDDQYPLISLGTVSINPSQALFNCDPVAYKESILGYEQLKEEEKTND